MSKKKQRMPDVPDTEIRHEWPPNIDAIRERFQLCGREIFAYDGVIYHPGGGILTAPLIAHERVHFAQQGDDPAGWWDRFLNDSSFRYEMELEAHREEFRVFCQLYRDRNVQWKYCDKLARRMASETYDFKAFRSYWEIHKELRQGIMR